MPHRNIPIFIPHMGCPNQCVFCNQRTISGCHTFSVEAVERQIEQALATVDPSDEVEVAFFGGSFTGIDRALMLQLLETAERFVRSGRVSGLRLSTRPDYIDGEILSILSRFSVRAVELGLQSLDDEVLRQCKRGHNETQACDACRAVVSAGFPLVGQMMIGLPGATPESEILTAHKIVALGADAVRIYPTVVLRETPLAGMTERGEYVPLTRDEAIVRSAAVLRVFLEAGIPCLRIGLCDGEELSSDRQVLAGPHHPALGEMVWNEIYYENLKTALSHAGLLGTEVLLYLPEREISKYAGHRRCNIERILRETDTRIKKIVGKKNSVRVEPRPWTPTESAQEEKQPCI